MNKTEFIQLIKTPNLPATAHIAALKQVLVDFPYFANARILLAKALHNEQHYEYEKFLKQTALIVPDREVLYHYIHNLETHWQKQPEPSYQWTEPERVSAEPVNLIETIQKPEEVNPIEPTVVINQDLPSAEPEVVEQAQEPIIASTPENSIADAETTLSTDELEADLAIAELLDEQNISVDKTEENPIEVIAELPAPIIPTEDPKEEHSFLEWLMLKSGQKIENPVTASKTEEEKLPEVTAVDNNVAEPTTPTHAETVATVQPVAEVTKADIEDAVAKSNVNDFQNILDKFIKENPSISRPKAEFFNPMNMARQSVEEDEELVTETLANLLYKQGNYKKAIRAYEKLCLKYPSKLSYFATLIQKIKTEIKD
jgi:tetratricopeptide (TPR) repeat protein